MTTRFVVGSEVVVTTAIEEFGRTMHEAGSSATVVRHGRDRSGVYTRVRFRDGDEYNVHRSVLKSIGDFSCCGGSDENPPEHTQDCSRLSSPDSERGRDG